MSGEHLIDGEFQSDKYPTTPRGKVPLSCKDPAAQDLLWEYAQRRRAIDAGFADDLEAALVNALYLPPCPACQGPTTLRPEPWAFFNGAPTKHDYLLSCEACQIGGRTSASILEAVKAWPGTRRRHGANAADLLEIVRASEVQDHENSGGYIEHPMPPDGKVRIDSLIDFVKAANMLLKRWRWP